MTLGLVLAWWSAAFGYETDQLTRRGEWLADALPRANAKMNELIDRAIAQTNWRTKCSADPDRVHRILVDEIWRATGARTYVRERGGLRGMGFGRYSAWLETADIARREFEDRSDIYGGLDAGQSLILATVGTCSTVRLGDVLVGTDKLDHFLSEGHRYVVESRWGEYPERGIAYGTRTERSYYGLLTSKAFSYADLRANWDGYRFYVGLLQPESIVALDGGCVERVGEFDWAVYVDGAYDEATNPPVLAPRVERAVQAHIDAHRAGYCEGFSDWGETYGEAVAQQLDRRVEYTGSRSPEFRDPWRLLEICGDLQAGGATGRPAASTSR